MTIKRTYLGPEFSGSPLKQAAQQKTPEKQIPRLKATDLNPTKRYTPDLQTSDGTPINTQLDLGSRQLKLQGITPELASAVGDLRNLPEKDQFVIAETVQRAERTINTTLESALLNTIATTPPYGYVYQGRQVRIIDHLHVTGFSIPYSTISRAMQRDQPLGADWIEDQDYLPQVFFVIEARKSGKFVSHFIKKQSGSIIKLFNDGGQAANNLSGFSVLSDRSKPIKNVPLGDFHNYTHTHRFDPLGGANNADDLNSASLDRRHYIHDTDLTQGLQTQGALGGHTDEDLTYHLLDAFCVLQGRAADSKTKSVGGLSEEDVNSRLQQLIGIAATVAGASLGPLGQVATTAIGAVAATAVAEALQENDNLSNAITFGLKKRGLDGARISAKETKIPFLDGRDHSDFVSNIGTSPELWVYGTHAHSETMTRFWKDAVPTSKANALQQGLLIALKTIEEPGAFEMITKYFLSPSVRIAISRSKILTGGTGSSDGNANFGDEVF